MRLQRIAASLQTKARMYSEVLYTYIDSYYYNPVHKTRCLDRYAISRPYISDKYRDRNKKMMDTEANIGNATHYALVIFLV
jgi:hypothetical protein